MNNLAGLQKCISEAEARFYKLFAIMQNPAPVFPGNVRQTRDAFFNHQRYRNWVKLSVCYSIAKRHNANIAVQTGKGGTIFFVRFNPMTKTL